MEEKPNILIVVVSGKDSLTRLDISNLIKSENIAIIASPEIPNLQSTETEHGFKNNRKNKFPPIQKTIRKV